ncbi:MAG: DUF1579 domain-containing protein [Ignavibacteriales bacterium]|nr:DUF1579 domain-containing protein [Ignavibacteriales bacterium]
MKKTLMLLGAAIIALAILIAGESAAQEKKKADKKRPSQEEMMKKWEESMTPGDAHKKLDAMVGTWEAEVKMWMNGPAGEATVSKGTSLNKLVLGGRYVQQEFAGEMMNQPFNGIGYTGYDNFNKKYVAFWIDNMSTGMATMDGALDKKGSTFTMWGKMDEPMTGEKGKKVKYVTRIIDADKHIFEVYDVKAYGDKKPTMLITYTRKKL